MIASADSILLSSQDYRQFITDMKARVTAARIAAARAANRDLILLYWDIGRRIVEKQKTLGWGESVVETVAMDLHQVFRASTGFSPHNLGDMRRLYLVYADRQFGDRLSPNCREGSTWVPLEFGHRLQPNSQMKRSPNFCNSLLQKFPGGKTC